jgi:hypothetical protein
VDAAQLLGFLTVSAGTAMITPSGTVLAMTERIDHYCNDGFAVI